MSISAESVSTLDAPRSHPVRADCAGRRRRRRPTSPRSERRSPSWQRDVDYLARWIDDLGDETGLRRIHAPERGPRLQIVHRREGEMGAVHDHRTWVAISPITGLEAHRRYRVVGSGPSARPERVEELALAPTDVVTMLPPDDLHDHGHIAGHGAPAYVLILTGDDQTLFERNEWDLVTGRHRLLRPGDRGRWLASEPMPLA